MFIEKFLLVLKNIKIVEFLKGDRYVKHKVYNRRRYYG